MKKPTVNQSGLLLEGCKRLAERICAGLRARLADEQEDYGCDYDQESRAQPEWVGVVQLGEATAYRGPGSVAQEHTEGDDAQRHPAPGGGCKVEGHRHQHGDDGYREYPLDETSGVE